jgi:carbamoyltransferase
VLVAPVKKLLRKPLPTGVSGLDVLKAERSTLPAVTHVDYSARVQTMSPEGNPLLPEHGNGFSHPGQLCD